VFLRYFCVFRGIYQLQRLRKGYENYRSLKNGHCPMAHILARKYGPGLTRYTAVVRIRKGAFVVHREAKTFTHRSAALTWAKQREVELENPDARAQAHHGTPTVAKLIRWYIDTFETVSKWQRSKQTHLEFLERHTFGERDALTLTVPELVDHVRSRRAEGAGPATVANDLIWLGVVFRAAKSVQGLPVRSDLIRDAQIACRELRLTGKSKRRNRRPTAEELDQLMEFFAHRDRRAKLPMRDLVEFAIQSARRESEICRLEWRDNNPENRTGLVRDAKHPTYKEGNHRRFKYTVEGWAIVQRQPKASNYIFPYDPKTVGAAFAGACHVLGIENLRFHDLRHEATSRLFERGYQIHEVAQFTLHDSWNELKRYANLKPESVRELIDEPKYPALPERLKRTPPPINPPLHAAGRLARRGPRRSRATGISARRV
jgi:integrase